MIIDLRNDDDQTVVSAEVTDVEVHVTIPVKPWSLFLLSFEESWHDDLIAEFDALWELRGLLEAQRVPVPNPSRAQMESFLSDLMGRLGRKHGLNLVVD